MGCPGNLEDGGVKNYNDRESHYQLSRGTLGNHKALDTKGALQSCLENRSRRIAEWRPRTRGESPCLNCGARGWEEVADSSLMT